MTGTHNDFAPDPVRTAPDQSGWGGGYTCCPETDRADGGPPYYPTHCYGNGRARGKGMSTCSGGWME